MVIIHRIIIVYMLYGTDSDSTSSLSTLGFCGKSGYKITVNNVGVYKVDCFWIYSLK